MVIFHSYVNVYQRVNCPFFPIEKPHENDIYLHVTPCVDDSPEKLVDWSNGWSQRFSIWGPGFFWKRALTVFKIDSISASSNLRGAAGTCSRHHRITPAAAAWLRRWRRTEAILLHGIFQESSGGLILSAATPRQSCYKSWWLVWKTTTTTKKEHKKMERWRAGSSWKICCHLEFQAMSFFTWKGQRICNPLAHHHHPHIMGPKHDKRSGWIIVIH